MNRNLKSFCLVIFSLFTTSILAQNNDSPLVKDQKVLLQDFSSKVKYAGILGDHPDSIMDSLKLKNGTIIYDVTVFRYSLQPWADMNWKYYNKQVDYEIYYYAIKLYQKKGIIKEYSKSLKENKRGSVSILFGFDKSKHLFMVADNNNNQRFDDDRVVAINYKSAEVKVNLSYSIPFNNVRLRDTTQMVNTSFNVSIHLDLGKKRTYLEIRNRIKDSWDWLQWVNNNSSVGNVTLNNHQYTILVREPMSRSLLDENERPSIYLFDSVSQIANTAIYAKEEAYSYFCSGDIVLIDGGYYKFEFTDWNLKRLKVTEVPTGQYLGAKPGFFIKDFTVRDYDGAASQFSSLPKGKYYLLDFWGSWCEPCLEKLPDLHQLYMTSKDANWPLEVVSIAFDDPFVLDKLQQFKLDYQMDWHLFYDNRINAFDRLDTSPIELLKIQCYPTFILVGPDGKILVRGCGDEGLGKVKEYLNREFIRKE